MLYVLVLIIHIIVVVSLISVILVQRGRSGGLVESLSGVESIFGTKTSSLLVKITVSLVIGFFLTSVSLAYISKQRGKSLMDGYEDNPFGEDFFSQMDKAKEGKEKKTVEDAAKDEDFSDIPDLPEELASSDEVPIEEPAAN